MILHIIHGCYGVGPYKEYITIKKLNLIINIFSHIVNVDSEAHITSHFVGIEGSFLGVKVAGLCTGHNSLPSAYVKNGCRYISARWMEKQHLALWGSPCSTGR